MEEIIKMENVEFPLSFNINEKVWVRLTDFGKKIYLHHYDNGYIPIKNIMLKVDGLIEFQLWCLMDIFGRYMTMGTETIFVNNMIYFNIRDEET